MQLTGRTIKAGQTLRYPTYNTATYPTVAAAEYIDREHCAHRNFYWVTHLPEVAGRPIVRLERGINSMRDAEGPDGRVRKPAILLRTTPCKAGSATTPWHDELDRAVVHARLLRRHAP